MGIMNVDGRPFPPQNEPPYKVRDLFEDIKNGVMLLDLLQVLSNETLVSIVLSLVILCDSSVILCDSSVIQCDSSLTCDSLRAYWSVTF